jgi:hypothetical protein
METKSEFRDGSPFPDSTASENNEIDVNIVRGREEEDDDVEEVILAEEPELSKADLPLRDEREVVLPNFKRPEATFLMMKTESDNFEEVIDAQTSLDKKGGSNEDPELSKADLPLRDEPEGILPNFKRPEVAFLTMKTVSDNFEEVIDARTSLDKKGGLNEDPELGKANLPLHNEPEVVLPNFKRPEIAFLTMKTASDNFEEVIDTQTSLDKKGGSNEDPEPKPEMREIDVTVNPESFDRKLQEIAGFNEPVDAAETGCKEVDERVSEPAVRVTISVLGSGVGETKTRPLVTDKHPQPNRPGTINKLI